MKFNLKMIAAAAALVAAAPAFAQLQQTDEGNAELVLSIWQQAGYQGGTANASYALDLGITYQDFLANASVDLYINAIVSDQYFAQLLSTPGLTASALQFSVLTGDRVDNLGLLIGTYNGSLAKPQDGNVVGIALDQLSNYTLSLLATGDLFLAANGSGNGSGYSTSGPAYYQDGEMVNFASNGFVNSSLVNTSQNVVKVVSQPGGPTAFPTKTILPGVFSFANNGGTYTLQYQVAAVPEASGIAMALAGFGLIGFIGRRRKTL